MADQTCSVTTWGQYISSAVLFLSGYYFKHSQEISRMGAVVKNAAIFPQPHVLCYVVADEAPPQVGF